MRALLALTLLLITTNVSFAGEPSAAANLSNPIVPDDWQALHHRWQKAMDELHVPGLAVVAVRGDQVVLLDALGVCDPEGKQQVTTRSPFYLASVTKSFTALGVAILVEEGKVDLDAPVRTYLPKFTLTDPDKASTITVRDLLCHRYGLDSSPITMAEAYFGNIDDDRYYRLLALVEPGTFSYSNLHYTLAGRIIEAVSGKRWQDFLAERVFAPLGMQDATCYASQLYANPLAAWPIVEQAGKWQRAPLVKNDAVMHAAGGMGSSAADLANWLRFQLTGKTPDGRTLVSPALLAEIHKQQARDATTSRNPLGLPFTRDGYSLGWFTGAYRKRPLLEHGGGYIGTSTYVSFLPEENVGLAVLVNESTPNLGFTMAVAEDVYAKLLGETPVDALPAIRQNAERIRARLDERPQRDWQPPTATSGLSQPVEAYVGTYENPLWGTARVKHEDDRLHVVVGTLPMRWNVLGEDRFELEILPGDVTEGEFKVGDDRVEAFVVQTPMGAAEFRKTP
ncbi:MAG: serine hydrolase [Planctomycetota bacterium]|nr:MAG: serine hydrolase [Planctomycetota bacterium]